MTTTRLLHDRISALTISLLLIIFAVMLASEPAQAKSPKPGEEIEALLVKKPGPVPAFELTDHEKKPFNVDRLMGAWSLVFFGYTNCPDVCPTTLTELDNAASRLNRLGNLQNKIQYVFVSVDPDRDTPELLANYISYFGAKFIAVTGNKEQLTKFATPLNIQFNIGIGFNKEYIVNHSSAMLLIDPQGRYYARFNAPHYAEEIVANFKALKRYYEEQK